MTSIQYTNKRRLSKYTSKSKKSKDIRYAMHAGAGVGGVINQFCEPT